MNTNNASDIKNPWLGLKSYSEGLILYGRDKEIEELSQKILYNTQTVIYGKSGIGKSSLLKAGVFPILRRHNYFPVYVRFVHEEGQISYAQQIFSAIEESLRRLKVEDLSASNDEIYKIEPGYKEEVVPAYDSSQEETMWEYFHRHRFYYQSSDDSAQEIMPVLIFDQFEEIFTLQKNGDLVSNFFEELSNLLNNVCPNNLLAPTVKEDVSVTTPTRKSLIKRGLVHTDNRRDYIDETNLHIVISLREDYLSYLERNILHIPSLKHNRYCLLPLNEDQAAEVIMQPVSGMVSKDVAKEIISKVTDVSTDKFDIDDNPTLEVDSAILSLFLRELFEKKPVNSRTIDISLINEFGDDIIQSFYEKVMSQISVECAEYLEKRLITKDGKRDSLYKSYLIKDKGFNESDIEFLKEKRIIREFPWNDGTRIEFIHDVLCPIIVKRKEQRRIEREKIEEERFREEERKKQEAQLVALKRKNTCIMAFILLLIMGGVLYYLAKLHPVSEKYASTIKCYGKFQGLERLTEEQASYRSYHFVLKKKGYASKIYHSMECRDKYNRLCTEHNMGTYLGNDTSLLVSPLQLQKVCKWEFVFDPVIDTKVIQERAYDKDNTLIFAFNYNSPAVGKKMSVDVSIKEYNNQQQKKKNNIFRNDQIVIGTYVDAQGLPLEILKEGYRFVKITRDDLGHDMLVEYFDWNGNQATNADQAYQTLYEYDSLGNLISQVSLNRYGKRMIDSAGNSGMICKYDGYQCIEIISIDEYGFEFPTKSGYSKALYKYDDYGRCIQQSFWNEGKASMNTEWGYHKAEIIFDDNQHSREVILFDNQCDTISCDKLINDVKTNKKGETVSEYQFYIVEEDTLATYKFNKNKNVEIYEYGGPLNKNYINKKIYDKDERIIEDVYYELDGITPYEDDLVYHKQLSYYRDNHGERERTSAYFALTDSIENYSKEGLVGIRVEKYYPNMLKKEITKYAIDTIPKMLSHVEFLLDKYGNYVEERYGLVKFRYFPNEKTKNIGDPLGCLTMYGFPYPEKLGFFGYYYSETPTNENGDTIQDLILPQIYTDDRNKTAVFIEYIDKIGRINHAVLLESNAGVCFGDDIYDYNNFGRYDDVICLDLLTMKIKSLSLYDETTRWTLIYNFPITTLEYEIYRRHYDKYKSENPNYEKPIYMKSVVHGRVEGADGYLPENGHNGSYFILKWCDWDCSQSIDKFAEEFENSREKNKDIILLPYEIVNDSMLFLEPISISCLSGLLGLRITEESVTYSCYKEDILGTYNAMN